MARSKCSDLEKTINQLAMNVASREGMDNLDAVTERLQELTEGMQGLGKGLTRETIADAIVAATEKGPQEIDEIQSAINAVKREARTDRKLRDAIDELEAVLERGEVPQKEKHVPQQATEAIQALRKVRDELKRMVAKSEPVQRDKLQKQIDALEASILKGDYMPKVKPPKTFASKEIEEMTYKRDELRKRINRDINNLKPKTTFEKAMDILHLPRALMTSFDLSAVFRQGGFYAMANPLLAAKSIGPMLRAAASKKGAHKVMTEIQGRANWVWYQKAKLAIVEEGTPLSQREEAYMSRLARFLPGIAASERAYEAFLNKLRADAFDTFARTLTKDGGLTVDEAVAIAEFINAATGRGRLPGGFEKAAATLNTLFFSPRLVASRFQMLGGAFLPGRTFNAKNAPAARRHIRRQYARYLIGLGLFYTLASLAFEDDEEEPFDIEFDPRSADFGKLRFGNTRLDPLSGLGQPIVLLSRLAARKTKSSVTGNIAPTWGKKVPYGGRDGYTITTDFLRSKFSPLLGTVVDIGLRGKTFEGDQVSISNVAYNMLPMTFDEVKTSLQEQGLSKGAAISLMAIMGMSVNTYGHAYDVMTDDELKAELNKHTYKRTGTVKRNKVPVNVKAGDPHSGEEGRVASIKEELKRRGIK